MADSSRPRSKVRRRLSAAERREVIEQAALAAFAETGYHETKIDEIARRSGVSPPIVYDHFESKAALHRCLLERTRNELLAMWRENLAGEADLEERVQRSFVAWARYVATHPYASRMFFRETTGVPEIQTVHEEIMAEANVALEQILAALLASASADAPPAGRTVAMFSEVIRGGLTELAIWWGRHPEVTDEEIVATAMNSLWVGFDRISRGEMWGRAS